MADPTPHRLKHLGWSRSGHHHLHKRWQFATCQQALSWYAQAHLLSVIHGHHCDFYLGNVGEGRIDTDILNRELGHLSRSDLDLARRLDQLEEDLLTQTRSHGLSSAPAPEERSTGMSGHACSA